MSKEEQHIDLLYRYVDGELDAAQSLAVEQELAKNEEWQVVYEGLLFAQNGEVNTPEVLYQLEQKITNHELKKAPAPIVPIGVKKWATIAAALAGFVLLSYAALQAINSGMVGNASDHSVYSSKPSVYPEDQIQIIPSKKKQTTKRQVFNAEEVEQIAAGRTAVILEDEAVSIAKGVESTPSASQQADLLLETAKASNDALSQPGSYSDLLARYGYREVDPNLLNTPRGAREISAPADHYKNFSRDAMTAIQLAKFKEEYEADYIARFPFNGVVKANFEIDENGAPINFSIIESPSDDATKVAKQLFFEKAEWQPALNTYGKPAKQKVIGAVSFGNSILIKIDFEE